MTCTRQPVELVPLAHLTVQRTHCLRSTHFRGCPTPHDVPAALLARARARLDRSARPEPCPLPRSPAAAAGLLAATLVAGKAVKATPSEHSRTRNRENVGMRHLETKCLVYRPCKEKRRARGKTCAARRSEHRGRVVRSLFEKSRLGRLTSKPWWQVLRAAREPVVRRWARSSRCHRDDGAPSFPPAGLACSRHPARWEESASLSNSPSRASQSNRRASRRFACETMSCAIRPTRTQAGGDQICHLVTWLKPGV